MVRSWYLSCQHHMMNHDEPRRVEMPPVVTWLLTPMSALLFTPSWKNRATGSRKLLNRIRSPQAEGPSVVVRLRSRPQVIIRRRHPSPPGFLSLLPYSRLWLHLPMLPRRPIDLESETHKQLVQSAFRRSASLLPRATCRVYPCVEYQDIASGWAPSPEGAEG